MFKINRIQYTLTFLLYISSISVNTFFSLVKPGKKEVRALFN